MPTNESARPGATSGTGNVQADETWTQRTTRVRRAASILDAHLDVAAYRNPEPYTSEANGTALSYEERDRIGRELVAA